MTDTDEIRLIGKWLKQRFPSTDGNRVLAAADELDSLRGWKAEAMQVLSDWEAVWETAGRPGPLGFSKAAAVQALIADLLADRYPSVTGQDD